VNDVRATLPQDPYGAFCRENQVALEGAPQGPLNGLSFAVKDVFDIRGHRTGFGHPTWLSTHDPAQETAPVIQELLDAGATLVGKTVTDELTYSLSGENVHYGTPVNPAAPDRIPGGSSNGSAVAVAGRLVDFALGTDCGGSVRVPASYCGLYGLRPSHGRVSARGVIPFAPSFDAVGWLTRDLSTMARVGRVILGDVRDLAATRMLVAVDAFELLAPDVRDALAPWVERLCDTVGERDHVRVSPEGLDRWRETFKTLQAAEIWSNHGEWIRRNAPIFGPGVADRFEWAAGVSPAQVDLAGRERASIRSRLDTLVSPGTVLCLPTSPRVAPLRGTSPDLAEVEFRDQAMSLLCIAGLGGLPQLSLPLAQVDGLPVGLSILGASGSDVMLFAVADAALR